MAGVVKAVSIQCEDFVKKHDHLAEMNRFPKYDMCSCADTARAGILSGSIIFQREFLQVLTVAFLLQFFLWNETQ